MDNFILVLHFPFDTFSSIRVYKDGKPVHYYITDKEELSSEIIKTAYGEKIYDVKTQVSFDFDYEEFVNQINKYEMSKYSQNKIKISQFN